MDSVFHSSIPTEASFSLERPNEISAAFGAFFKQALARVETRFEEAAALDIPNSNLAIIRSVGVETEPEHGNDHLTSEENCAKEYHFRSQIKARGRTNLLNRHIRWMQDQLTAQQAVSQSLSVQLNQTRLAFSCQQNVVSPQLEDRSIIASAETMITAAMTSTVETITMTSEASAETEINKYCDPFHASMVACLQEQKKCLALSLAQLTAESKAAGEADAQKLRVVEERLAVALEMLGERSERISELEADIADMKMAYRRQTEELLERLNT